MLEARRRDAARRRRSEGCRFDQTTMSGCTMEGYLDLRAGVDDDWEHRLRRQAGAQSGASEFLLRDGEARGGRRAYELPVGAKWDVVSYAAANRSHPRERNDKMRRVQDSFGSHIESSSRTCVSLRHGGRSPTDRRGRREGVRLDPWTCVTCSSPRASVRLTRETAAVHDVSRCRAAGACVTARAGASGSPRLRRREPSTLVVAGPGHDEGVPRRRVE